MGGSNVSVTDLSVYQSALTKIGQDLNAKASNINQQKASGKQNIRFNNTNPHAISCKDANDQKISNTLENCIEQCQENRDTYLAAGGSIEQVHDFYTQCTDVTCPLLANSISPCTDLESKLALPQILGCDIELSQNIEQSIGATQIASAQVDAEMTANIMNTFENEVEKIISQTNEDLNILQSNSAHERTTVSQQVRNEISNAITSMSSNVNTSWVNGEQDVEFNNGGIINCCGNICDPETNPDCAKIADMTSSVSDEGVTEGLNPNSGSIETCGVINISQNMAQQLETKQKASSVIESVFNSSVVNDLYNKYKYSLTQKNAGVDPWGFMYALAAIIIAIVIATALAGKTLLGSVTDLLTSWAFLTFAFFTIITIVVIVSVTGSTNLSNTFSGGNTQINIVPGAVKSLSIDGEGSGYVSDTTYGTVGGTGSGLRVKYTSLGGTGFRFVIDTEGSGYTLNDVVQVDAPPDGESASIVITKIS